MWPKSSEACNTFSCIDKVKHARRRRVMNSALSDKAVRSAERFVIRHVDRWCELITSGQDNQWSPPRNMADWTDYLLMDIFGDLCYGKSFDTKEPGDNPHRSVPHTILHYQKLMYNVRGCMIFEFSSAL